MIHDCPAGAYRDLEFEPPERIAEVQDRLLAEHVQRAAARSPF
jgi:hypothetical protein